MCIANQLGHYLATAEENCELTGTGTGGFISELAAASWMVDGVKGRTTF